MRCNKKLIFILLCMLLPGTASAQNNMPDPAGYPGYNPGESFTPYYRVVDYFSRLAVSSDKAVLVPYGHTYEQRPLQVIIISSKENMSMLEGIRKNNLRRTGLVEGEPVINGKIIVWLSYNVHGNESSSTEASMVTAWRLIQGSIDIDEWLRNVIVIIDPCLNPDGRERYVNWFRQNKSDRLNPSPEDVQHHEPWPGGRTNHYLFDLNRDWSWVTQTETKQRLKLYNDWMPQVHVDFHEQEYTIPYYFAPAAKPYHSLITRWQKEFQQVIGKNNASHFDENGWLYFTGERFDLLYPGYGDTYPTFNGAIGMTYEQAGGEIAGLGVTTDTGDTLTLADRVSHHVAAGLSTVEVSSQHAGELETNFITFFKKARSGGGDMKEFIVSYKNGRDKLLKIMSLLDAHKIRYGHLDSGHDLKAFDYHKNTEINTRISPEDLVIPVDQPKSVLIRVLFEKATDLQDTLTYDITAWSLPYAFGIDTYGVRETISGYHPGYDLTPVSVNAIDKPYAFAIRRTSIRVLALLADLQRHGINVRTAMQAFTNDARSFPAGSLIVTLADNRKYGGDLSGTVQALAIQHDVPLYQFSTGLAASGVDLGSPRLALIRKPRIGLLSGPGVTSYASGEIWYMFEKELDMTVHRIDTRYFSGMDLSGLDVLIFPGGDYESVLRDDVFEALDSWVAEGGRLILIGEALKLFEGADGISLKKYLDEDEKSRLEDMQAEKDRLLKFGENERHEIRDQIIGGIYRVRLDNTHPIAFGYPDYYFTLKVSEDRYALLDEGWNVGTISGPEDLVCGFAGSNTKWTVYKSLALGVEDKGDGQIVYFVDDPVFRSFWENGKLLLGNAVFMPGG